MMQSNVVVRVQAIGQRVVVVGDTPGDWHSYCVASPERAQQIAASEFRGGVREWMAHLEAEIS